MPLAVSSMPLPTSLAPLLTSSVPCFTLESSFALESSAATAGPVPSRLNTSTKAARVARIFMTCTSPAPGVAERVPVESRRNPHAKDQGLGELHYRHVFPALQAP